MSGEEKKLPQTQIEIQMDNNSIQRNSRKYYYIDSMGHRRGPVEAYKLPSLQIKSYDYVWTKGMREWSRVRNVPDLASVFFKKRASSRGFSEGSTIIDSHIVSTVPTVTYHTTPNVNKGKSFLQIILPLLIAIGCFALAALVIWLLVLLFNWFLNDGKSHSVMIRAGIFIVPILLIWEGLKNLVSFFVQFWD